MIKTILGLGTFPAVKPVHGGQRRAAAFKNFYFSVGIEYVYSCIYDSAHYAPPRIGPHDIPLVVRSSCDAPVALIGDLLSGRQGADHEASFQHFLGIINRLKPDALQLEQPFMWPLAKRLRQTIGAQRLPVIYSSYNVEAPLKHAILLGAGVSSDVRRRIAESIEEMEAEICREAALVVCVSASERNHYLRYCMPENIVAVPNGTDRPPSVIEEYVPCRDAFGRRPFALTVGSAYPPNIEGLANLVFRDGAFMVPPLPGIAICGGVADGILGHPRYQRFHEANSYRVRFFPKIDDKELFAIKAASHVVALPIETGAGSNLKTAEALALGKWIVATKVAMRGYENFIDAEGVTVANESVAFRTALAKALRSPPLVVGDKSRQGREALYWDRCFRDSDLTRRLAVLQRPASH